MLLLKFNFKNPID